MFTNQCQTVCNSLFNLITNAITNDILPHLHIAVSLVAVFQVSSLNAKTYRIVLL